MHYAASDIADLVAADADFLLQHGRNRMGEALHLFRIGLSLEEALGAAPNWRSTARLRARDAALSRLSEHFRYERSALGRAGLINVAVGRYHDGAWRRDYRVGRRPDDALDALCFDLLKTTRPLAVRTIRDIIGRDRAVGGQESDAA